MGTNLVALILPGRFSPFILFAWPSGTQDIEIPATKASHAWKTGDTNATSYKQNLIWQDLLSVSSAKETKE